MNMIAPFVYGPNEARRTSPRASLGHGLVTSELISISSQVGFNGAQGATALPRSANQMRCNPAVSAKLRPRTYTVHPYRYSSLRLYLTLVRYDRRREAR